MPVGSDAIGTWSSEGHDAHRADEREESGQVEPERVADVRQQHAERGAVELVDRVEAEQDEERVDGGATR